MVEARRVAYTLSCNVAAKLDDVLIPYYRR